MRRGGLRIAAGVPEPAAGAVLAIVAGLGLVLALPTGEARSQETVEDPPAVEDAVPPPVALDSLLRIPDSAPAATPPVRLGGATRREWKGRFEMVRAELRDARRGLERAQQELEGIAAETDNWQMTAPGGSATAEQGPLSYRLRQEIRSYREQLESAERALRELEIEANLAGVPEEWQN
jgi:hypothetical protein